MEFEDKFSKMLNLVTGSNDPALLKSVIEFQKELVMLQEENRLLRQENHELKNERILDGNLMYKNNAYYKRDNDKTPYCSKCYDVDKILVSMSIDVPPYSVEYEFSCPNCKNRFNSGIPHNQNTDINF